MAPRLKSVCSPPSFRRVTRSFPEEASVMVVWQFGHCFLDEGVADSEEYSSAKQDLGWLVM